MSFNFIEKRNIIVIGTIGTGKSTLINKIIGKKLLEAKFNFSHVTTEIEQVAGRLEMDECTTSYDVTIIDTVGMNDGGDIHKKSNPVIIEEIKEAITDRMSQGVNLIFITLNLEQRFSSDEKALFDMLQLNFKEKFWKLSVLVFTHCDKLKDKEVEERLKKFRCDEFTKEIADTFVNQIVTVGFPSLDYCHDKSEAEEIEKKMKNDILKLHKIIENATKIELPKYIINEQVPRHTPATTPYSCIIL